MTALIKKLKIMKLLDLLSIVVIGNSIIKKSMAEPRLKVTMIAKLQP